MVSADQGRGTHDCSRNARVLSTAQQGRQGAHVILHRMPRIIYLNALGDRREVEVPPGNTLMEGALDAGVAGILADCGGACACATCHVYVEEGWFEKLNPPSPEELDMLDMALAVEPNSRLSCQIPISAKIDGIKVTLAPE